MKGGDGKEEKKSDKEGENRTVGRERWCEKGQLITGVVASLYDVICWLSSPKPMSLRSNFNT